MSEQKICVKCGQQKRVAEFWRDKTRSDGIHPYCKDCCRKPAKPKPPPGKWSRVKRTCEHCLICFDRKPSLRNIESGEVGRYCSDMCYRLASPRTIFKTCSVWFKKCSACGADFTARQRQHHLCSDDCRGEYNRIVTREYDAAKKKVIDIVCKECGTIFRNEYGVKNREFCSRKCMMKSVSRAAHHKRRAATHGARAESVSPIKVFMRDGWRCQLCGSKTPKKHRGTTKSDAPELDHIIPLSVGGEHSYKNTQCSCRSCNINKGSRKIGQLRLC